MVRSKRVEEFKLGSSGDQKRDRYPLTNVYLIRFRKRLHSVSHGHFLLERHNTLYHASTQFGLVHGDT